MVWSESSRISPPPLPCIPRFWRFFDLGFVLVLSVAVLVIVIVIDLSIILVINVSCGGIPGFRRQRIGLAARRVWLDAHFSSLSAHPL